MLHSPLRRSAVLVLAAAGSLLLPRPGATIELQVAVAANFLGTLQRLAPAYQRSSGNRILISAGSTGGLYTQIRQGAPFDVFLSADAARPKLLESEGLAVTGSRCTYAVGALVLWSPRAGLVDAQGKVLDSDHFRYLAIADPHNAPYGAAAVQELTKRGLWQSLNRAHRIVIGENISQTWQFAESGNADLAFVALSQVIGSDGHIRGSYWLPPQSAYAPIDQDALALAHSAHRGAASAFVHWLCTSPQARQAIHAAGYAAASATAAGSARGQTH